MKLILGTAQLGLNYGISGKKPDYKDSIDILKFCEKNNILTFDTAQGYGNSEEILSSISNNNDIRIITKIDFKDKSDIDYIIKSINKSCKNLKVKNIDVLLLHSFADFKNKTIINNLVRIKKSGLIKKLGASVYNVNEAKEIIQDKNFSVIQIPFNYLDRQWDDPQFQKDIYKSNIEIHVRSIFLRGILINDFKYWPKINNVYDIYNKIQDLCAKYKLSKIELVIGFIKSIKWINGIIFGVDNINQLSECVEYFNNIKDFDDIVVKDIENVLSPISSELIDPRLWI